MNADALSRGLGQEEFLRIRELLYEETGILFEDGKADYVSRRVLERMQAVGCKRFFEYISLLRYGPAGVEMQQLINAVTVNETYFFREEYQLRCLVDSMLNEVAARRRVDRSIRLWSIPCATGEEPYSLAIYLLERWPLADDFDIEIVASDIDTNVLRAAERGLFPQRSVERVPEPLLHKYFTRTRAGTYQICDALRQSVTFTRVNLTSAQETSRYQHFDVVFCRNMLIYFDDASRRQVVEVLYEALNPGGFICLGHSESMSRISVAFQIRKFPEAIVYQRPLGQKGLP